MTLLTTVYFGLLASALMIFSFCCIIWDTCCELVLLGLTLEPTFLGVTPQSGLKGGKTPIKQSRGHSSLENSLTAAKPKSGRKPANKKASKDKSHQMVLIEDQDYFSGGLQDHKIQNDEENSDLDGNFGHVPERVEGTYQEYQQHQETQALIELEREINSQLKARERTPRQIDERWPS